MTFTTLIIDSIYTDSINVTKAWAQVYKGLALSLFYSLLLPSHSRTHKGILTLKLSFAGS